MSIGLKFSAREDENLVHAMASHPCIYNSENKDYKNLQIKSNVWKAISEIVGRSEEECKRRWRAIKDNFLEIKKSQKQGTGSARDTKSVKWHLYEHLKFLETVKYERRSYNTIAEEQNSPLDSQEIQESQNSDQEEDDPQSYGHESERETTSVRSSCNKTASMSERNENDEAGESSAPSTSKKRRTQNIVLATLEKRAAERTKILQEICSNDEDDVDMFMKSVAATVKKLSPRQIADVTMRILALITEIQFPPEAPVQQIHASVTVPSSNVQNPQYITILPTNYAVQQPQSTPPQPSLQPDDDSTEFSDRVLRCLY